MLFMEVPAADADSVVRGVVDLLKERGLYEKATFIVVGGRGAGAATGHLDDATLRIPLIVKQPDRDGAGRRVHAPVQHIDLMPTVLDLVRAPIPGRLRGALAAAGARRQRRDGSRAAAVRRIAGGLVPVRRPAGLRADERRRAARARRRRSTGPARRRRLAAQPDAGRAERRRAQRRARSPARPAARRRRPPRCRRSTRSSSRSSAS